jgi:hypothetical protein
MALHWSTLRYGKAPFPYRAESVRWISAPGTPSAHKNRITARYSSLVHAEIGVAMINLLLHYKSPVKIRKLITIMYRVRASTRAQNKECSQYNKL